MTPISIEGRRRIGTERMFTAPEISDVGWFGERGTRPPRRGVVRHAQRQFRALCDARLPEQQGAELDAAPRRRTSKRRRIVECSMRREPRPPVACRIVDLQ